MKTQTMMANLLRKSAVLCCLFLAVYVDTVPYPVFNVSDNHRRFETTAASRFGSTQEDLRVASQSRSFAKLKKNVMSVLQSLSTDQVDPNDKRLLLLTFEDIFRDYQNRKLEEFQPAQDDKRRIPYGTIHRLAHDTIDNMGLSPSSLGNVHRAIHYAFSNSYNEDVCYPEFATNHTGCLERQGKTGCSKVARGVNEAQKKVILAVHNQYRSEVARGDVVIHGNGLPQAAAMARMAWDEELEALAQAWADQCTFSTDCGECRRTDRLRYVGQSVLRFRNVEFAKQKPEWRNAIDTLAQKSRSAWPKDPGFLNKYRHDDSWSTYTQMIWDFSYLVGCGYSMYKDDSLGGYSQVYVCNYGPAGNMIGHEVYVAEKACSKCPPSHVCQEDTGLCTYGEELEAPAGFQEIPVISQLRHKVDAEPESAVALVEI